MNKKSFFIFLIVAALFASFTQSALADYTVQTVGGYGPYQTGQGGEFTLLAGGNNGDDLSYVLSYYNAKAKNYVQTGTFQSFCLEWNEHIYAGEVDKAEISDGAVQGGVGGIDPISIGTAWLYSQFAAGTLAGYEYTGTTAQRKASAAALQNTIWWLEGEANDPTNSNIFRSAVVANFGNDEATAKADNGGVYAVSVLNLTYNGELRQDMLVATPIPPAIWLFGTGLIGLVGVRRRFTA